MVSREIKTGNELDYEAEQELNCLIQALEEVIDKKADQKKAYEEYEGYSPGYALANYNDAVADAVAEFGNYLGKVIDRRVKHIVSKLGLGIQE
jgi:hypothetical protein